MKLYELEHRLRELQVICCSLLPGEVFSFFLPSEDTDIWSSLLDALDSDADGEIELPAKGTSRCSARLSVRVPGIQCSDMVGWSSEFHITGSAKVGHPG
ncbi:hypothetical protein EDD16DRAFT_1637777 [Pisolithus croceorrhizus]|nr:hypothetical protein EDD16DRAFT_1637777 [Pisolithus croceorrhizus]